MENNIQSVIIIIISAILLFIFPVYVAYEKKDEISYALVLSYTQEFVETTRKKGYITLDDYEDFRERISTTGNLYDVELIHKYNRYDYYKEEDEKHIAQQNVEIIETDYIENILREAKIYTMNVDDTFNVVVKNTNRTLATALYNMVTLDHEDNNVRIYVNASGLIIDTKWYTKEDLKFALYDKQIDNLVLNNDAPFFEATEEDINDINFRHKTNDIRLENLKPDLVEIANQFIITLKVDTNMVTNIEKLYDVKNVDGTYLWPNDPEYDKYNVVLQANENGMSSGRAGLQLSIGMNGIMVQLIEGAGTSKKQTPILQYTGAINKEDEIQIVCNKEAKLVLSIYLNGERVAHNRSIQELGINSIVINKKMYIPEASWLTEADDKFNITKLRIDKTY